MILKRYGASFQSVELNFDSKALSEVAFRRNHAFSVPVEEFRERWVRGEVHPLTAEAEGWVQDHTEQTLLDTLQDQVEELLGTLEEGQLLVFENEDGQDYPKTRQETRNVVEEGENKLHFHYTVAPALRFTVYRDAHVRPTRQGGEP